MLLKQKRRCNQARETGGERKFFSTFSRGCNKSGESGGTNSDEIGGRERSLSGNHASKQIGGGGRAKNVLFPSSLLFILTTTTLPSVRFGHLGIEG